MENPSYTRVIYSCKGMIQESFQIESSSTKLVSVVTPGGCFLLTNKITIPRNTIAPAIRYDDWSLISTLMSWGVRTSGFSGSGSALSPTPSPSVSIVSFASWGKASALFPIPSPSSSEVSFPSCGNSSVLFPTPSKSSSWVSSGFSGNRSELSPTPSPVSYTHLTLPTTRRV